MDPNIPQQPQEPQIDADVAAEMSSVPDVNTDRLASLPMEAGDGTKIDFDETDALMESADEVVRRGEERAGRDREAVASQKDELARMFFAILVKDGVDPSNPEQVKAYFDAMAEEDPDRAALMEKIFDFIEQPDELAPQAEVAEEPAVQE
jgi:hypothetical protein